MNKLLRYSLMALLCAVFGFAYADTETVTFSEYGASGGTELSTLEGLSNLTSVSFTFDANGASNAPKYYSTGARFYKGNKMTIAAKDGITIQQIVLTFASQSNKTDNAAATFTGCTYDYDGDNGIGTITNVTDDIVMTNASTNSSGDGNQVWITDIVITYTQSSVTVKKPVFSPESGYAFSEQLEVTISCETEGASIYYNLNSEDDPNASSILYEGPITISETTTVKAVAILDNTASPVVTATYKLRPAADWYESFDGMNGVGGNDGVFSGISGASAADPVNCDNEGWTFSTVFSANKCVYLGTTSATNIKATTPVLGLKGEGTLYFKAVAWGGDTNNFFVDIEGDGAFEDGTQSKQFRIEKSKEGYGFGDLEVSFSGITEDTKFVFRMNDKKRAFLDEVYFVMGGETPPVVEVPVPTFSPEAGEVDAGSTVTIAAESDDYEVYYTLDGTSPIDNSSAQGGDATVTVTINEAVTIKAAAMDDEGNWSEVVEAAYTVKAAVVIEEPVEEELPEGTLFWEQFSQVNGTGGRDGAYTGSIASSDIFGNSEDGEHVRTTDMIWGYMSKDYKCYGAKECMKFGSSSVDGECMTREIALSDAGTLTFSAAGWGSGTNTLTIQAMNGFLFDEGETQSTTKTITLTNGSWEDYSFNIVKAESSPSGGNLQIHFTGRRGFIDDIKVVEAGAVVANTPTITPEGGIFTEPVQVTIASDQSNASIYYTLDGTDPTNESTEQKRL